MDRESLTSTCVGSGSPPPRPANMASKIGTMKMSMIITATTAMISTITG